MKSVNTIEPVQLRHALAVEIADFLPLRRAVQAYLNHHVDDDNDRDYGDRQMLVKMLDHLNREIVARQIA